MSEGALALALWVPILIGAVIVVSAYKVGTLLGRHVIKGASKAWHEGKSEEPDPPWPNK